MTETPTTGRQAGASRSSWDFTLMAVTVALLAGLGLQSFIGTVYAWWAYRTQPGWEVTGQAGFVSTMNAVAAPMLLALVVVMGLCVPKRLFSRHALVVASALMVGLGAAVGIVTRSAAIGLGAYLGAAGLIQVAVVVLTIAGAGGLTYLREGRLVKVGSGLLHLGFIVFALTVVALQRSALMLPVFWVSTALTTGGTLLSFYARTTSEPRPAVPDDPGGEMDEEPTG